MYENEQCRASGLLNIPELDCTKYRILFVHLAIFETYVTNFRHANECLNTNQNNSFE